MIRNLFAGIGLFALVILSVPLLTPASAHAATFGDSGDTTCSASFLGFPTWYRGLPRKDGTCDITMPSTDPDGTNLQTFIFTIILNIIDIALRLVGFAAVGFIIYGGFKYLTAAGSADRITAGRKIILNAIIGLGISMLSVAIVNLIASNIK